MRPAVEMLLFRGAPVGLARPKRALERDPIAGRPDQLARHRPRFHEPVVLDPHLDVAARA
jgi:hypothetical protein